MKRTAPEAAYRPSLDTLGITPEFKHHYDRVIEQLSGVLLYIIPVDSVFERLNTVQQMMSNRIIYNNATELFDGYVEYCKMAGKSFVPMTFVEWNEIEILFANGTLAPPRLYRQNATDHGRNYFARSKSQSSCDRCGYSGSH